MNQNLKKHLTYILFFSLLFMIHACTGNDSNEQHRKNKKTRQQPAKGAVVKIISPTDNKLFKPKSSIGFKIKSTDSQVQIDSIKIYLNDKLAGKETRLNFEIPAPPAKVGPIVISIKNYLSNGKIEIKNKNIQILSDIVPSTINYELKKTYEHATENFTQGLEYNGNFLYESTGEWGNSTLLKRNLVSNEPIQSTILPDDVFGEGITILNKKIYQLTYQANIGYVYELNSFKRIKEFAYPNAMEGWGITNDGTNLIMGNGSNILFVMDTSNFAVLKEIHVYDDKGKVNNLNELEFADNKIYANIWMSNKIAKIDYHSGKVEGYINLEKLVPGKYKNHHANVLNGIAFLPYNGNFVITGKRWEKLYEIKLD